MHVYYLLNAKMDFLKNSKIPKMGILKNVDSSTE